MPTVLLDDLAQRIRHQEAQLQALRQELESRQQQLAELTQRKEHLLTQLQQIDTEIAAIGGGAPATPSSRVKGSATQPARAVQSGGQPAANGAATQQTKGAPRSRGTARAGSGQSNRRAGQPTLPELIVTLLREAGRPLTVKELGQEIERRGFPSQSSNFPKMLAIRVGELKRKGILRGANGQPGYVLPQASNGKRQQEPSPAPRSTKSRPQKPVQQKPLREVLLQILQKSSKPMSGRQLAAAAVKAGYHSRSKSFVDVVWLALSQLKNVEHIPNQGYRLKQPKT